MILHGWLNIDKPAGITSYGVIARLKRLTGQPHIGHAGTLDPLATGVLPIAFGQAARTIEFLHLVSKTYRATVELGIETDTLDAEGKVISLADASHINRDIFQDVLESFIGTIQQVPPMYSALKRNGVPLYELARRGETVDIQPRTVIIDRIDLIDFTSPLATIDVECGSGTYIRSLARDLGQRLGVGGYLKSLRRTRYGIFDIKDAVGLDSLKMLEDVVARLLPNDHALAHCPRVDIDSEAADKLGHGVVMPEVTSQLTGKAAYRIYDGSGELLGLIDVSTPISRLKVFNKPSADT